MVRGNNNGLHRVDALMFLKMRLSVPIIPRFGRGCGKWLDLVGIKSLQGGKKEKREDNTAVLIFVGTCSSSSLS